MEALTGNWQQYWPMHELSGVCTGRAGCTFPSDVTGMLYSMQGC